MVVGDRRDMEAIVKEENAQEDDNKSFSFETDQVALKNNSDYKALLSTVARLEALRMKTIADLGQLQQIKNTAKSDPLGFIEKLQNDPKSLKIPSRPVIPELPDIHWERYLTSAPKRMLTKHTTRGRKFTLPSGIPPPKPQGGTSADLIEVIRGRVKDESKSETFNQLWTPDEQIKLEELLREYPPERIEARRFRKIADRLGNKTYAQVASRIQKYFIRLARSGLPVPGRVPSLNHHRIKRQHRHHKRNSLNLQQSTFLQGHVPPVFMSDYEDSSDIGGPSTTASSTVSSEDNESSDSDSEFTDEIRASEEFKQLEDLRAVRLKKLQEIQDSQLVIHAGFQCDGCGLTPITGTRWHCTECSQEQSVDLCTTCHRKPDITTAHNVSHKLHAFTNPETNDDIQSFSSQGNLNDKDYLPNKFNIPGHYNYLDPNYMPAK